MVGWAFPVIWYCLLAKLFGLYAKGNIFGADCIRCIKWAGFVCVSGWLLSTSVQVCFQINDGHLFNGGGRPPIHFTGFSLTLFDVFFIRNIEYIDFGLLVLGIAVVLIAWIMDEGRKIQEEQELTV